MSQNSRQRRDARRRAQGRRASPIPPRQQRTNEQFASASQAEIIDLIALTTRYVVASPKAAVPRIQLLNELGQVATIPQFDPAALVVDEVLSRIRQVWEHGWQPQELVHAARRRTSAGTATWVARAVLVEAGRTGAMQRAPQSWADQLTSLTGRHDRAGGAQGLLKSAGQASVGEWTIALIALDFLQNLPPSQPLVPPPSTWGQTRQSPRAATTRTGEQAKTLTKIRALLAKAESTEFTAEAEAFTAKAQDLMTRHSIDEALLADETGLNFEVAGLRVLIDHPYASEKASLLHVVAKANRSRSVWSDFASHATLLGAPTDVSQVEMLFTSTLVQATRAMTQAGEMSHGADRRSGFRKAFLTAYAVRIGERLAEADSQATTTYGSALVPVFQRQAEAIDQELERLFPHVTTGSSRSSYDLRGWNAGRQAADQAVLPAGEVEK